MDTWQKSRLYLFDSFARLDGSDGDKKMATASAASATAPSVNFAIRGTLAHVTKDPPTEESPAAVEVFKDALVTVEDGRITHVFGTPMENDPIVANISLDEIEAGLRSSGVPVTHL